MGKERLTVVLGAGSTIEIGFPSTQEITQSLEQDCPATIEVLKEIEAKSPNVISQPNFEHIIQHIIDRYGAARKKSDNDGTRQSLSDLQSCIRCVKSKIISVALRGSEFEAYQSFYYQLQKAFDLDIISLNYDNILEEIVFKNGVENGFDYAVKDYIYRFNEDFSKKPPKRHRILRLHGCINFVPAYDLDVNITDIEKEMGAFKTHSMYWHRNPKNALEVLISQPGGHTTPSHEIQFSSSEPISPIISGIDKRRFFHVEPYKTYYDMLDGIFENSRLLIIGYNQNENDEHLNRFLQRAHRKVIITKDKELTTIRESQSTLYLTNGFLNALKEIARVIHHLKAF